MKQELRLISVPWIEFPTGDSCPAIERTIMGLPFAGLCSSTCACAIYVCTAQYPVLWYDKIQRKNYLSLTLQSQTIGVHLRRLLHPCLIYAFTSRLNYFIFSIPNVGGIQSLEHCQLVRNNDQLLPAMEYSEGKFFATL